ncbi:MAG: VWA domain-containing protein [Vicinamibacteraceae bacterium]
MTRLLLSVAIAACVMVDLVAAQQQQAPVFRTTGDVVHIFVTVTDRDGRLVTTLARNDFEVRDEGKPQPISLFDNSPQPIQLVVLLDVSGSMEGNLRLLREATEELIERLRPEDVAAIGSFGREIEIAEAFTRDPAALRAALPTEIPADAPTPLWQAVDQAMDTFGERGDARRVVLVLSDGKDTGPASFGQRYVTQVEVIDRSREDDVMIYALGLRSRGRRPMMTPPLGRGGLAGMLTDDLPDPGLSTVALETGGGYAEIKLGEDLGAAFARVADELHSQYLLGFEPPKRDGKVHEVDVRVSKRGMEPRARKSYVAPEKE